MKAYKENREMLKPSSFLIIFLLLSVFITSCGENIKGLPTATTNLSTSTPLPTFTTSPEPSPTLTSEPTVSKLLGIGVTRQQVQSAYEKLSFTFDEPIIEDGMQNITGHIVLADATGVGVFLIGKDENLHEASVNILLPKMLLITPKSSASQHGKVLFIMQVLLDAVFPAWKESGSWLDESFRSFDGKNGKKATVETTEEQNIVTFEVELPTTKELSDYMTISLTIKAK